MSNLVVAQLEVPSQPERREPAFERASVAVGAASVWVADVQRNARELARRLGAPVALTIALDDGTSVGARELLTGPGEGFVTVRLDDRELALRLDRVARVELARATGEDDAFVARGASLGFAGEQGAVARRGAEE